MVIPQVVWGTYIMIVPSFTPLGATSPLNLEGNVYKIDTTVSWNRKFNHFIFSNNLSLTDKLNCVKSMNTQLSFSIFTIILTQNLRFTLKLFTSAQPGFRRNCISLNIKSTQRVGFYLDYGYKVTFLIGEDLNLEESERTFLAFQAFHL